MHRAEVGQDVLAAVDHHEGHGFAGFQTQCGERGRDLQDPLTGLAVGQRAPAVALGIGIGGRVMVLLGRLSQLLADGTAGDLPLDLGPDFEDFGHGPASSQYSLA